MSVKKYIERYSEVSHLENFPTQKTYSYQTVIPAFEESPEFIKDFQKKFDENHLLIVVINRPEHAQNNQQQVDLFEFIVKSHQKVWQENHYFLFKNKQNRADVLVVDCFTQALPSDQGVGLARKVGADLATLLWSKNIVSSRWISSTDADVQLPSNYFQAQADTLKNDKVLMYAFKHIGEHQDSMVQCTKIYERALVYYVAGLKFAGSAYAYPTIGSIFSFDVEAYCQVRGFPKKSAGEDFYLLNKLIKVGNVFQTSKTYTLNIQSRFSDRVPFGTGPMVKKIHQLSEPEIEFLYYHPKLFHRLKETLTYFNNLGEQPLSMWDKQNDLPDDIWQVLIEIGYLSFIKKQITQKPTSKQLNHQLKIWFDAFRTLKFIHTLRKQQMKYQDQSLQLSIKELEESMG